MSGFDSRELIAGLLRPLARCLDDALDDLGLELEFDGPTLDADQVDVFAPHDHAGRARGAPAMLPRALPPTPARPRDAASSAPSGLLSADGRPAADESASVAARSPSTSIVGSAPPAAAAESLVAERGRAPDPTSPRLHARAEDPGASSRDGGDHASSVAPPEAQAASPAAAGVRRVRLRPRPSEASDLAPEPSRATTEPHAGSEAALEYGVAPGTSRARAVEHGATLRFAELLAKRLGPAHDHDPPRSSDSRASVAAARVGSTASASTSSAPKSVLDDQPPRPATPSPAMSERESVVDESTSTGPEARRLRLRPRLATRPPSDASSDVEPTRPALASPSASPVREAAPPAPSAGASPPPTLRSQPRGAAPPRVEQVSSPQLDRPASSLATTGLAHAARLSGRIPVAAVERTLDTTPPAGSTTNGSFPAPHSPDVAIDDAFMLHEPRLRHGPVTPPSSVIAASTEFQPLSASHARAVEPTSHPSAAAAVSQSRLRLLPQPATAPRPQTTPSPLAPASLDPEFERAVTELLREAARRHGIDV